MEFLQYHAGALHEAGHAAIAVLCGREIQEMSILTNEDGGGFVARKRREDSPKDVLEEILIALAGEAAPYLWGDWSTDAQHDMERINELMAKAILPMTLDLNDVRAELTPVLESSRHAIGTLAEAVSARKQLSGAEITEILQPLLPNHSVMADLVEAILQKQSQLATVLGYFPNLLQSWNDAGSPTLENTFVGTLLTILRDDGVEIGLAAVEGALASLRPTFTPKELSEQLRDLFVEGNRSQSHWEKSWTELTGFAHLNALGLLSSLGWPLTASDTAAFDCVLALGGHTIPCDIKSSLGSGFSLLQNAVGSVLQEWALTVGTTDIPFALRYQGTLAQETVGPALHRAIRKFRSDLAATNTIPTEPLQLNLHGVRCEVFLGPASEGVRSGGIQGAESLAKNFVGTYHSHVQNKSSAANKHGQTPFLLMYVLTPGSGMSDLKTSSVFQAAITHLNSTAATLEYEADKLWLGSVLLDVRLSSPRVVCCFREAASWPDGVVPDVTARELRGQLVLV